MTLAETVQEIADEMGIKANQECPACGGHYDSVLHRQHCLPPCQICSRSRNRHRNLLHVYMPDLIGKRKQRNARSITLAADGIKELHGCQGKWPEPCRDAWPATRQLWCDPCKAERRAVGGGK